VQQGQLSSPSVSASMQSLSTAGTAHWVAPSAEVNCLLSRQASHSPPSPRIGLKVPAGSRGGGLGPAGDGQQGAEHGAVSAHGSDSEHSMRGTSQAVGAAQATRHRTAFPGVLTRRAGRHVVP